MIALVVLLIMYCVYIFVVRFLIFTSVA